MRVVPSNLFQQPSAVNSAINAYSKSLPGPYGSGSNPSFQSRRINKKSGALLIGFLLSASSFAAHGNKEIKVMDKVSNYVATQYVKGQKTALKDSTEVFNALNISQSEKAIVKKILANYETQGQTGYLKAILSEENLTPRKQKLKEKAIQEFSKIFFEEGKLLKSEDIEKFGKKLGIKENEMAFFELFIKPFVELHKKTYLAKEWYAQI